jgi:hypothetical protein
MDNVMSFLWNMLTWIENILKDINLSNPYAWIKGLVALIILVVALVNLRNAEEQQDMAFDMDRNTAADRICRQIRLLETRVWTQTWSLITVITLFFLLSILV